MELVLCHTMLGKSPLVPTLFANFAIDESLEERCFHLPPKVVNTHRISFGIWLSAAALLLSQRQT
jgi:hypothetical protein